MSTRKIVMILGNGFGPEITVSDCTRMVGVAAQFNLPLLGRL